MTTNNHIRYHREVKPNVEESLSKIIRKIDDFAVVLDVGCSSGFLGKYLIDNKGCTVDGVDVDLEAIKSCQIIYRRAIAINLEQRRISDAFVGKYDFIVVADVLEHLFSPEMFLNDLPQLLKDDGVILFSIPNITHIAVGIELLNGHFEYRDNGLLDKTHMRFFSRSSLISLLSKHDLFPWEIDVVSKQIYETEFDNDQDKRIPEELLALLTKNHVDALTYQWIVSAKPSRPDRLVIHAPVKDISNVQKRNSALEALHAQLKLTELAQINAERLAAKRNEEIQTLTVQLKLTEQAQANAELFVTKRNAELQTLTEQLKLTEQAQASAELFVTKRNAELQTLTEQLKLTEQAQVNANLIVTKRDSELRVLREQVNNIENLTIYKILNWLRRKDFFK